MKVIRFLLIFLINFQTFALDKYLDQAKSQINDRFNKAIEDYKKSIQATAVAGDISVQNSSELSENEQESISNRKVRSKTALKNFTGQDIDSNIAFCGSGGGYRAMIYNLGALKGAHEIGLLDCANYMSALSGSTWALNSWLLSGKSIGKISNEISSNIAGNRLVGQFGTPFPEKLDGIKGYEQMIKNFVAKSLFKQPLTSVDLWGAIIIGNLLGIQSHLLSSLQDKTKSGEHIFALNTAVNPKESLNYDWYEVTPFDVRNLSTNMHLQIEGFGRKFANNASINRAPELPASFYLGIFGSAFTVSPEEYVHMTDLINQTNEKIKNELTKLRNKIDVKAILDGIIPAPPALVLPAAPSLPSYTPKSIKDKLLKQYNDAVKKANDVHDAAVAERNKQIENLSSQLNDYLDQKINNFQLITQPDFDKLPQTVKGARFLPAKVDNPSANDLLTLVDAGININLPIKPLLKQERNIDIIFVFDASETVEGSPELQKAIKSYDLNYDKVSKVSDTLHVYQDSKKLAPTIVYIPMAKGQYDAQVLKNHGIIDAQIQAVQNTNFVDEVQSGFCSTFNFKYSQEQFEALFNLGRFNLISNAATIKDILTNSF